MQNHGKRLNVYDVEPYVVAVMYMHLRPILGAAGGRGIPALPGGCTGL